jgi:hypothetical protein
VVQGRVTEITIDLSLPGRLIRVYQTPRLLFLCIARISLPALAVRLRGRAIPLNDLQIPAWRDETSPSDVNFVHHSWEGYALPDVFLGGQPGNGLFDAETDLKNLP